MRKVLESGFIPITYYPHEKGRINGWNEAIEKIVEFIENRCCVISNPAYLFDEDKLKNHIEVLENIKKDIKKLKKGDK